MPMKKRLTENQEFEIMKLVLDKFLWIAFIVMGYGFYKIVDTGSASPGALYMIAGVVLLIIFIVVIVKEYEIIK